VKDGKPYNTANGAHPEQFQIWFNGNQWRLGYTNTYWYTNDDPKDWRSKKWSPQKGGAPVTVALKAIPQLVNLGGSMENMPAGQTKLGMCEGDCDKDSDCQEGLICYQRDSSSDVPTGCVGGGPGDIGTHDYCAAPGTPKLVDLGASMQNMPAGQTKLGQCEGDCDSDNDCQPGLYCYQRDSSSDVPFGCSAGGKGDIPKHDYCVAKTPLVDHGGSMERMPSGQTKLGMCEGDCDKDSDCAPGLYCYQRDSSSDVPFPCRAGGIGDLGTHDYCVAPLALKDYGGSMQKMPKGQTKLGMCEGDCDSDNDCAPGLFCFQRDKSSQVPPGCKAGGKDDKGTHDYCAKK
jgi:hypothetical protein